MNYYLDILCCVRFANTKRADMILEKSESTWNFMTIYDNLRLKFFSEISDRHTLFKDLDVTSKLLFLFNSIDPSICRSIAAFVFECMRYRHDMLFQKRI